MKPYLKNNNSLSIKVIRSGDLLWFTWCKGLQRNLHVQYHRAISFQKRIQSDICHLVCIFCSRFEAITPYTLLNKISSSIGEQISFQCQKRLKAASDEVVYWYRDESNGTNAILLLAVKPSAYLDRKSTSVLFKQISPSLPHRFSSYNNVDNFPALFPSPMTFRN